MPELPEVETVLRGLKPELIGRILTKIEQRRENLRFPIPEDFVVRLTGQKIRQLSRRAKYILVHTENGQVMILHLGMSGRVMIHNDTPDLQKHDHLVFVTDAGRHIVYNDARRFGFVDLTTDEDLPTHRFFHHLGPEPLSNEFSGPVLYKALKQKKTPIKSALLDQRIVAGLGNIYVCEALYHAKIRPTRQANRITKAEAEILTRQIKTVLDKAIAAGGSSLRDYRQASGELGYFQHQWAVYGKAGLPCPGCGYEIRRIVQSGRSSFYCPACQS